MTREEAAHQFTVSEQWLALYRVRETLKEYQYRTNNPEVFGGTWSNMFMKLFMEDVELAIRLVTPPGEGGKI